MNTEVTAVGALDAELVRSVLMAAAAAPSLHNSQPWHFRCTQGGIEVHADRSRAITVADPDDRELLLACGAALCNLRLAITVRGIHPDVRYFPSPADPDLLAVVRPAGHRPVTPLDRTLAGAIHHRRTNRKPFLATPVPGPAQDRLRRAAEDERCWLASLDPTALEVLRTLVRQAHETQLKDPDFVSEWARWTGRDHGVSDGVPAVSSGPIPEPQDAWVLRDFSAGKAMHRTPGKDFEPDPLIVIVGSFQDTRQARLRAGLAMQRVLLTGTTLGLSASFLSQVVEVADTRRQLRTLIGGALWPQSVLRIGYGSPVPSTPRRPLEDVLDG